MKYCLYYQATLQKELCWLVTSTLRYSEYLAFDRCYDKEQSVFEFFVMPDADHVFLDIMQTFESQGIVSNIKALPNRLMQTGQEI
jgi:hypothetical protein